MICARCAREVAAGAQRCPNCAGDPLLDGRYRLDRQLGSDSVGVSYRATRIEDATLVRARSCMLRRLPDEPERSAGLTSLRALEHAGLPRWLDELVVGEGQLATLWSIHEHVAGQSLAEALAAAPDRRFDQAQTMTLLRDLADVLAYLHGRRTPIVHGALRPSVIQLRSGARPACLLDLGWTHAVVHGAGNRGLAESLAFAAPEQRCADATAACDVWALGAIVLVASSGASLQSLRDATHELRWRERVQLDHELARMLERMLEPDAARRIDALALREALKRPSQPRSGPVAPRPSVTSDVPIKRPDELSRELSQAHHVATTLAQRQRAQLVLARVLVALVTALIAGLATYVVMH